MLFFQLLVIFIASIQSEINARCSNGREPLLGFSNFSSQSSVRCSRPRRVCLNGTGVCNKDLICCPRTLRMSNKKHLVDRATGIVYTRISDDFRNSYRLFELNLTSKYDPEASWRFLDSTLRDLFEMPDAKFWYPMITCLEQSGRVYAMVPLNTNSVATTISAMIIVTQKLTDPENFYICYVATKREHRRRGLATRLLQQIVQLALEERTLGTRSVIIHVNTLNTAALELYERCGWRCFAYLPEYLQKDPYHETNHAYALLLTLDDIKNVTSLCRDPNAVDIDPSSDEHSIQFCHRKPVSW